MKSIVLYNRSNSTMTLMLEPLGLYFDIPSNREVTIMGTFDEHSGQGEIGLNTGNCISVWASLDATVTQDGKVLEPNKGR